MMILIILMFELPIYVEFVVKSSRRSLNLIGNVTTLRIIHNPRILLAKFVERLTISKDS
jgi:hypothetical protein